MTVYADVLVVLNLIVDYFLLSLSAYLLKKSVSVWRMLLAAFIGAVSSLYIFLPPMPLFFESILKLAVCILMTFAAFGYKNLKDFFRSLCLITTVSFIYCGGMIAVFYIFRPNGMLINNSVIYFNISPIFLIGFSVVAYMVIILLRKITEKNCVLSDNCKIEVVVDGAKTMLTAIVDTGNSVEDIFSLSEIIVVDESIIKDVFSGYPYDNNLKHRYRALPMNTVSGTALLDGYRCDKAYIHFDGKNIELKKPILAISKTKLYDGYNAIVNPKIFE